MASRFKPIFSITNAIASAIAQIERARGFLEAAALSDAWITEMEQRAFVLEAHHTTRIEGTRLTLAQAERLLTGERVPEADPDDARELLNYRSAFDFVSENISADTPITEDMITGIHARLVAGVRGGEANPGSYRTVQNYVVDGLGRVVHQPPPPEFVEPLMETFVTWLNDEGAIHPIIVSGIAQFQLVQIHPFVDGNGRTSRLLSMLCMYRAGYDFRRLFSISEYYDRDRPAFYRAIQSVRETRMDMTQWLEYFVEGLTAQLAEVRKRGEVAIRRDDLTHRFDLSQRQQIALDHVLRAGSIDIHTYERLCADVGRRTLQRDLEKMVKRGLLGAEGETHQRAYRLADTGR